MSRTGESAPAGQAPAGRHPNGKRPDSEGDRGWDALVAGHPEGTIFHTRAWGKIVLASFRAVRDRGVSGTVAGRPAVLPLFEWARLGGALSTRQSSFPFVYGGAIPATIDGVDSTATLAQGARAPLASWRITGNPFAAAAGPTDSSGTLGPFAALPAAGFTRVEDTTRLLRLPEREDGYWDGVLTTAKRNDFRRLQRKGVTIAETREPADLDAFYRLYLGSFARWGGRPRFVYPSAFYLNLLALGGASVRFTVARYEGEVLGGAFTLRAYGKAHYLAGYFDPGARALRPNVLLQIESILSAIRDGFDWYDFLPSGGHAGVDEFKESLGGKPVGFPVWVRTGPLHRLLRRG